MKYPWALIGSFEDLILTGRIKKIVPAIIFLITFSIPSLINASENVLATQKKLNELGFIAGPADGIWGNTTKNALIKYLSTKGLKFDGSLDNNEFKMLGIIIKSGYAKAVNSNSGIVTSCDSDTISLPNNVKSALMTTNMTQCAMPFGILIAADKQMPKKYVHSLSSIVAEFLDQDRDGLPDDRKLYKRLKRWKMAWLAMPTDPSRWEKKQIPKLSRYLGYEIIAPKWWMYPENEEQTKMMLVEEAFHFITQFGLSEVYPTKFSVNGWGSTIAKETKLAACKWWQHPENSCPNSPSKIQGDCTGPSCDVTEFFQQVVILRAGMKPGWFGIGFPKSKTKLNELLSDGIKEALDNDQYHIINKPLQFDYYR